jgi:hypothetical protein
MFHCQAMSGNFDLDILDIVQNLSKMSKVGNFRKAKKIAEFWISKIWHESCTRKDRNPR